MDEQSSCPSGKRFHGTRPGKTAQHRLWVNNHPTSDSAPGIHRQSTGSFTGYLLPMQLEVREEHRYRDASDMITLQGKRIENSCIVQPKSVNLRDRKIFKCELLQRCAMFFEMSDISFYTSSGGTVEDLPIPRGIANGASSF